MKAVHSLGAAILIGVLATPSLGTSAGGNTPRVGMSVFGGYGSYAMGDVNDLVDGTNVVFHETGLKMDALSGGLNLGIGVNVQISRSIEVEVDYERLSGSTKIGESGASIEYRIPVNSIGATMKAYLLASGPVRVGLGGGLGYYKSAANAKFSVAGQSALSEDWSGNALGIHGLGLLDCRATPRLHLQLQAGYRHVQIRDVDTVLPSVMGLQGSSLTLDWSGVMTRLGITVYLTPAE